MNQEEWKDIPNSNGIYQISSYGRVRNAQTGRILKLNNNYGIYQVITLKINGKKTLFKIHRLVGQAFIPNPLNKEEVNHIDGNKYNNTVSNLEWNDRKENMLHAHNTGLQINFRKTIECAKQKNQKAILQIKDGKVIARYEGVREVTRKLGYSEGNIAACARGKFKTMYGYEWKYEKKEELL